MLYCETCGAANADDAEHCFACQKPLSEDTAPLSASSEVEDDARPEFVALKEATLLGRYRVLAQVGTGGFGAVYQARDLQAGQRAVAVKEIKLRGLKPQEIIDATDTFNREVQVLSDLSHPNLPRIYDHFTDSEHWYLVMDFIEGQTLEAYLRTKGGRLPLDEALDIGAQLCSVLEYLHAHNPPIIFRDLKPANVMLTPYKRVYLIDFGTARFFKPGQARDTIAFGSPGYAAPEQYGKAQSTPRSDIYGLGATLHTMLTGKDPADAPFHFEALRLSNPSLPVMLDDLILDMVRLKVSERPISAAVVKEHLQWIATEYKSHLYPFAAPPAAAPGYASGYASAPLWVPSSPGGWPQAQTLWTPSSSGGWQQQQMQMPPTFPTPGWPPNQAQQNQGAVKKGHGISRRLVVSALLIATIGGTTYLRSNPLWASEHSSSQPVQHDPQSLYTYYAGAEVSAVACSPNSRRVASGDQDGSVQAWDATTGENAISRSGHTAIVNAVTWSPDGNSIASASADKTVRVWSAALLKSLLIYRGHASAVNSVAWSPNGRYIASAADVAQVWDARTGTHLLTYARHSAPINQILWLPGSFPFKSMSLVTCSGDGTVQIWNARSGKRLAIYRYSGSITAMACSPSGQYIAFNGSFSLNSNPIQVCSTGAAQEVIVTYSEHIQPVTALAWSPDGHSIASASMDGTVRVWDAATGQTQTVYTDAQASICSVAWSPDGAFIVGGGSNGAAYVWQAPAAQARQKGEHNAVWGQD